ncbi:helix-turn-helix transcriptional regulator [Actinophytocola sp.]|uniref:helix-turn-helix transcriptional regulator n=1 Tax=Actinophytocola sp. TaxID=1872138 RepID=UPI00389B376C
MGAKRRRTGLVATRKAAGYTQEGLAEALFVDRCTVNRWESGHHAPVPYLWPKLAKLLGVTREQLAELLADNEHASALSDTVPTANQAVALEDMKRRTLMKWGVAATAAASLTSGAGTTVGLADVQRLQRAAARLHGLDQRHGGDALWQAALVQAYDGTHLLDHGSYTETVGQLLLTATGQLYICAGWLALDAGQHQVARDSFGEALSMSRQANDPKIETRALANLAYQSTLLGKPREAQRYAYGAELAATGKGAPKWLAAIPQLRLAVSSSRTGNARDADRAVGQARRVLDRDSDTAGEEWAAFLSSSELDGIEATCAIELGRPTQAERLLEQTIASYEQQFARNLAGWRVRLARARLDKGAVDGAAEAAHGVLDDLSGEVASWRVGAELDVVAARLTAAPEVPEVADFLDRYRTVVHA